MLQSAPSTNIDASFAFSISTNESVEAASAPQQSFNSGWANNHDESETESVIAARKQSKKKRTKKVAAGMKETKAMKLAEREMIAERKAATKTLHGDDIMIEKPVRAVKRKATGEAAEAGTKRKKRDDESSDEENEDLAEKKPRKAPAAERPTRRAAISSRKVIEDTDTGEDSDDDKFVYDGDSDFDRRGGDDEEEDNDQVEDHSPDIEVPSSPSTKLSKPAVTKRSTSTKTKPRKSTETTEKGWGKAEDKSVRDRSGEIGSSNFRTLNLQKSKFGRSGRGGGGRFGGGRGGRGRSFGGSSGGGGGSRVSYKSGGGGYGGYSENPYTSKEAEEVMQDLYDETERKRLLDLPEIEFIFNAESEGLCRVSQSYFDGVQEEGDNFFVDLHAALKTLTGLETFRPGQENTIRRILQGESTILVLPTGGGKSLCYQLPAFILRRLHAKKSHQTCVTLVISPMVSLMQDQMRCLPPKLKGVSMSSGTQSITEYKKTMDLLTSDQADILYVTPEKLQTEGFQKLIQTRRISVVRLACIDEVHCLTEWSHNFRTSYLSLNSVFEEVIGVKCVLGLTATATVQARKSVVKMLGLDDTAIVAESRMRDNLKLSVSKVSGVDNRDMILENMLKTDLFSSMSSIIIYTMFQSQADNIAKYLRTRNFSAESYHAGKPPMERAILQEKFMQNRLQIMVATVAFGLGINKQDVRAVIHYNIPKSLENYSQEIGRAGRDGDKSYCHVFLCPEDYVRHRSFAYSEGVDEASVWRFILRVFRNAAVQGKGKGKVRKKQDGVSVGKVQDRLTMLIPVEATERELDMKESVLATLLTYMEGFEGRPIKVFPAIFCEYIVHFNKKSAFDMAETNPIVAAILKNTEKTKGKMTVDALKICEDADVSFSVLAQTLAELKRKKEIHYEGTTRAFHIELTNLEASEGDATYLERMRTLLTTKMRDLETSRVAKLDMLYETLLNASVDSVEDVLWTANDGDEMVDCDLEVKEEAIERMETLKKAVENYFETENGTLASASNMQEEEGVEAKCLLGVKSGFRDPTLATRSDKCKKILRIDLNDFIVQNAAVITSGRAIARIFHGISSPKFPAYEWFKNKSWNSYSHFNFGELVKIASKTLMEYRMRTGNAAGEELGNEDMDW
ncbi:ATP-dependent DNA helicase [Rhizoclosmatium globosum]|uniref:DNA 3'-5' helicase n=1 Tax=Rhizoclosmatium globosum TaxID=329046 RepID=A0A1Y2CDV1_9FUNG|nr:ATP-dependent DNA helicase [Rhizoclosmatium globosum]|eukprot:ORY45202.1 ATP-dependent DNA helicase [Rhizoclosmatium globosum]